MYDSSDLRRQASFFEADRSATGLICGHQHNSPFQQHRFKACEGGAVDTASPRLEPHHRGGRNRRGLCDFADAKSKSRARQSEL